MDTNKKRKQLGTQCRKLREKHGISPWKMAQLSGTSLPVVGRLEKGEGVTINSLLDYLNVLGKTIEIVDELEAQTTK